MAISEFTAALNQVASERNIKTEDVLSTLKEALVVAYAKEKGVDVNEYSITADISEETGAITIMQDGKDVTPPGFGRIASQVARRVIMQSIRTAERMALSADYKERIGEVVKGYVSKIA